MEKTPSTSQVGGANAPTHKPKRAPTLKEIERRMLISQTNKIKSIEQKFDPGMEEIKIPKHVTKPIIPNDKDIYDMTGLKKDPRRRKSWPEFCRDFIGQTQGAIAQDLLELHNSMNPNDRIQFLKFMMEMGKTGYPANAQLDPSETRSITNDIYAQLEAMSTTGIAPTIGQESQYAEKVNEAKEPIPENSPESLPETTDSSSQDLMAQYEQGWKASKTIDDPYATEDIQEQTYSEEPEPLRVKVPTVPDAPTHL